MIKLICLNIDVEKEERVQGQGNKCSRHTDRQTARQTEKERESNLEMGYLYEKIPRITIHCGD